MDEARDSLKKLALWELLWVIKDELEARVKNDETFFSFYGTWDSNLTEFKALMLWFILRD